MRKHLVAVVYKDDIWINTGDMIRELGFNHAQFGERSGDSYRWKGENTSANEVEKILDETVGVDKSAVYGVTLSKYDGKAGMTSLVLEIDGDKTIKSVYDNLKKNLQMASMPLFIRVVKNFEMTKNKVINH